jgi:hypothetical protein
MKEDPVFSYDWDVFRRYDSIFRLARNYEIRHQGHENNFPCRLSWTKCHLLKCGHTVFIGVETSCLSNCDNRRHNTSVKTYFCTLCTRDGLRTLRHLAPKRWHDVLLPSATYPAEETGKSVRPNVMDTEPAYLDPHGFMLIPRVHCTIAMVRACEMKKEEEAKALITKTCAEGIHNQKKLCENALEFFEIYLQYHTASSSLTCATSPTWPSDTHCTGCLRRPTARNSFSASVLTIILRRTSSSG